MAQIFEKMFAVTPPGTREQLRKIKYRLFANTSPAAYWNMAARLSAKAAIYTDCVDEQAFFASGEREAALLRIKKLLGRGVHAINIGCGMGRIENAICAEVGCITGVDVSSRMVELARRKVVADNVRFMTVDGKSLDGLNSDHYDLCVSFMVLQHISRRATENYMRETCRILKRDGHFLFQLPVKTPGRGKEPPLNHPFGMRYYSPKEVGDVLRSAGLDLIERFDVLGRSPVGVSPENQEQYEFYLATKAQ